MVKPVTRSRLVPPAQTRGIVKVHKLPHRKAQASLKQRRRSIQPVAGTAKAGGQDQGQEKQSGQMEEKGLEEFLNTGRTGRRNAMSNIGDENAAALSTADLPLDMAKLSCAEGGAPGPSTEASQSPNQASKPPS